MTDLWRRNALDIAAGVAAGDFSATEVVRAHLDRIDEVNPRLNAIVRRLDESALAAAAEVDRARAAGETLGPLAGVPVSVKENIDMAGIPTTQGLVALADAVSPLDAPVVERMRAADAIPIGRTNLPDMGLRVHTDNALHGLTRNPWHHDRTTAGSSGGEASSLASGMSALGLGNDLGGSLRNPASACGIASIKPSLGLVPHAQLIPVDAETVVFQAFAVQGPMARRVADVRAALHVLAGPHVRDPFCVPARLAPVPHQLRIAVAAEPPGGPTHPAVAERTRAAAAALADAGCVVDEVDPPRFEDVVANWGDLVSADVAFGLPLLEAMLSPDALAFLRANEAAREPATLESVAVAWMTRQQLMRDRRSSPTGTCSSPRPGRSPPSSTGSTSRRPRHPSRPSS